jgi:hypothetical protein
MNLQQLFTMDAKCLSGDNLIHLNRL